MPYNMKIINTLCRKYGDYDIISTEVRVGNEYYTEGRILKNDEVVNHTLYYGKHYCLDILDKELTIAKNKDNED
jgi:hypothetical protein